MSTLQDLEQGAGSRYGGGDVAASVMMWVVALVYLGAFLFAAFCMYLFGQVRWYWHAAAIAVALGLGVMPSVPGWQGPQFDMIVGSLFIVLFTWGVGEPIYDSLHLPHFHRRHQA